MEGTWDNISKEDLDASLVPLEANEEKSSQLAERSLAGRIITSKPLNRGVVKAILHKAWGEPTGMQISDMGINMYLFTFSTTKEAQDVLNRSPWFVMNHLLNLQKWNPAASIYEINFGVAPFWVQMHGLPLEFMKFKNAVTLANRIGNIIEVEDPFMNGNLLRTFFRVRVSINIKKAIPTGCWVPHKGLPNAWVVFRYERMQDICYNCGILGHDQRGCKNEKVMASHDNKLPRYDSNLGVPPARPLAIIVAEQG